MSIQSLIRRYIVHVVTLGLGILIGVQLTGAVAAAVPSANEGVHPKTTILQSDPVNVDTAKWYTTCNPENVATYTTRVHIKCTVADNGIQFFAAPTSNSKHAARVLSLLLTAQAAGKQVSVLYDPADTSGTAYGCLEVDCRPILAVDAH